MGYLSKLSTVVAPARLRAENLSHSSDPFHGLYAGYYPLEWATRLSTAGVTVTPELALTLSAMFSGVTTIGMDLATVPALTYRRRDDEGKDRVRPVAQDERAETGGIGSLAYRLRWQPNGWQTAAEWMLSMVAQFLLREVAYAEIAAPRGFIEALLPRHPDRVIPERLPSGRLRYKLLERLGVPRYVTQDSMLVIRGLSLDGLTPVSRIAAGTEAIGSALAAERAAAKFFKSGMTAAMVATYKGDREDRSEEELHGSISRFAAGVEHSFGLMLIPDDVSIETLGVEPEKAQMMLAREWGVREVARLLRLPGSKLGIKDSVSYNSQVQAAIDYVIGCLRPIAVFFEQAFQRDLILAKDTYFVEFLLEAMFRGDPDARAQYYERAIRNRWMRPSEVRLRENLNPDPALDKLSEGDFRPGSNAPAHERRGGRPDDDEARALSRGSLRALWAVRDNAVRCLQRERAAVEKLARKHASDVPGWQAALRDFYADHAGFVARTMHLSIEIARDYAAQHGAAFEAKGLTLIDGDAGEHWERFEADELSALALEAPHVRAA